MGSNRTIMAHRYRKGSITYHVMDKPAHGSLSLEERPLAGVHSINVEESTTQRIRKTSVQANAVKMRCLSVECGPKVAFKVPEEEPSRLSIGIMQPVFQISSCAANYESA